VDEVSGEGAVQVVDLVEDRAGEAVVPSVLGPLTVEGGELDADGEGAGTGARTSKKLRHPSYFSSWSSD
jgi:hypothetical protein